MTTLLPAQPPVHYRHGMQMPTGAIGHGQVRRGGPLLGYTQPVRIRVPDGAELSIADEQSWYSSASTVDVGLLVGQAYRLKVSQIPNYPQAEIYPSVELVNRLYPPPGQTWRFPVPIEITQADLQLALQGKMVVRVVYIENPNDALPAPEDPTEQRYFDVLPSENPLQVADQLGRPIAIVRLGSRVPNPDGPDAAFLFGAPPVCWPHELADALPQTAPADGGSSLAPIRPSTQPPADAIPSPDAADTLPGNPFLDDPQ